MNIRSKFILQFLTVSYSTFTSIFETSILYRTFNLETLGTFFILQSSTIIISSLLNIRIVETTQILLNKYGLSKEIGFEKFSKLYSFYLITLFPLIPFSFFLIFIFNKIYIFKTITIFFSLFFISLTIILGKITGIWYAYQFHKDNSQNISIYEILKKLFSLILIFALFIINPKSNQILFISLSYFLKSFVFFIYELKTMYRFIKCKIIYSLSNPIKIIKEFIFYESEVSSSIKTSYLRNLFSSIVKNGDIAIAGIIGGPEGSGFLKIIKSVPTIILQPSQYINNFAISYINRSSKSYKKIFEDLIAKSLRILPIALLFSLVYFLFSDKLLVFVYQVNLSQFERITQSFLLFISFFILIFSWAIPLHISRNRYKLITINSIIGSSFSLFLLFIGLSLKINLLVYISLILGIFITFILNTICHIYNLNFQKS